MAKHVQPRSERQRRVGAWRDVVIVMGGVPFAVLMLMGALSLVSHL
jgi:hypothetical protein